MGPLEDGGNRGSNISRMNKLGVDPSYIATEQLDCETSCDGASEGDGDDDLLYLANTMPVDDTCPLEEAFETQVVDLDAETQVIDLDAETQVIDLDAETQVIDLAGETQVLDDLTDMEKTPIEFNADAVIGFEASNNTAIFSDTQELTNDSRRNPSGNAVRQGNIPCPVSRSNIRDFTSIRVASIRASGLAARSNANSFTSFPKIETCAQNGSLVSGSLLKSGRNVCQEFLQNDCTRTYVKLKTSDKCKTGSTAVRKLFGENDVTEVALSEVRMDLSDGNINMPELLSSENCFAGLSYVNSQEPGELSQTRALEVVDRFLDLNDLEYDESPKPRIHLPERPEVISVSKGSRDLAQSSILKDTAGGCEIYDWDYSHEDDGGGDFFVKRKELLLDEGIPKRRCLTEPGRRSSGLGSSKAKHGREKGQDDTKRNLGDLLCSDSRSTRHRLRPRGKSVCYGGEDFIKNLNKDFDKLSNVASQQKVAENDTNKGSADMQNIGPDTQMAAEAMETLCFELHMAESNGDNLKKSTGCSSEGVGEDEICNQIDDQEHSRTNKFSYPVCTGILTRQAAKLMQSGRIAVDNKSSPFTKSKSMKHHKRSKETEQKKLVGANESTHQGTKSTTRKSEKKHHLLEQPDLSVPLARRTRKCTELNHSKASDSFSGARKEGCDLISAPVVRKRRTAAKGKNAEIAPLDKVKMLGSNGSKKSEKTRVGIFRPSCNDALENLNENGSKEELLFADHQDDTRGSVRRSKRSREATNVSVNTDVNHMNCLSTPDDTTLSSLHHIIHSENSRNVAAQSISDHENVQVSLNDVDGASKQHKKRAAEVSITDAEILSSACATPADCTTKVKNASPICMGDEYHRQSCRTNLSRLSLAREVNSLLSCSPRSYRGTKDSRKRRDIADIRVLFSQHLDDYIVKQQKKILARLGGGVASSMSDATHFVTDEFIRTRNMLEAIALGKPVVTQLWLESCRQASCLIDEKNYILRDAKKEKEFGFSLPVSLSRASQHPLLEGRKVLITPNAKPGKDVLANFVKAVHGSAVQRLGRSVLEAEKLPDDLLILSCEEDYDLCEPFLEKGAGVYSSELLLNGIVKQKLEYERHRLFVDHVKSTRSTLWVKKKGQYLRVRKSI